MPYILVGGQTGTKWWGGLERIRFDPANPETVPVTTYLLENGGEYLAQYKIRSSWEDPHLTIEYHRKCNQHLFDERPKLAATDIIWGVHVLTIEHGAECGPSIWQPDKWPKGEGPGWRLEAISGGSTKRRRGTIWAIQREQQSQFRQWLLAEDGCCALTGETCKSVLEAAHIVPAHHGGQEVPSNGILLRADIHRLFDATPPKFEKKICPESGKVLVDGGLYYDSFDLRGKRIDDGVHERVARALQVRQKSFDPA